MLRRVEDFLKAYENLVDCTSKIFATLTDENLDCKVAYGHRSLGQIAWHIVASVAEMMGRTGMRLSSIDQESPPPISASEIAAGYRAVSTELVETLKATWNDDTLLQTDDMYGEQWPRGVTLSALIQHEIHHRGQMTVLLRQAGGKVPGTYGPSKEEWTQYGMQPPAY